jgi:hypothetical protein
MPVAGFVCVLSVVIVVISASPAVAQQLKATALFADGVVLQTSDDGGALHGIQNHSSSPLLVHRIVSGLQVQPLLFLCFPIAR